MALGAALGLLLVAAPRRTPAAATSPTKQTPGPPAAAAKPTTQPAQALLDSGEGKKYVVVKVDGPMMSRHGTVVLQRSIRFATDKDASLLVVYLETPGGLAGVMLGMRDALVESPMPTLGFVRQAYSAGALLALATDRIYMHPMAHIGDAIPLQLAMGQPKELEGDIKEKILAPMRKEFATTARVKGHREDLALAMVDLDVDLPQLDAPKGKILVLDAPTAVREGLAVNVVSSIEEAVADMGLAGAERLDYKVSTADKLASFMSTPLANIVLIVIVIGGIVVEVKTPGFGLGGFVAIVAVFLFFWANWYANLAHWLEIVLFLVGVGLVIAEIVVPGFGILGISGIICIVVSIFLAMFRLPPAGFEFDYGRIAVPVRNLAWALVGGVVGTFLAAQAIRHSRIWQRVSLGAEMEAEKGFTGTADLSAHIGREGIVLTDLRPVGTVRIDDRRFDAMTEGDFISRGKTVKVIRVDTAQLVVEPVSHGSR